MRNILLRLLKPIASACLLRGVKIREFLECFKIALVFAAEEELIKTNHQVTTSKLSVMTGIHRKDIERIKKSISPLPSENDLITKVVGQWQLDPHFCNGKGKVKLLDYGKQNSSFSKLVRAISKELNPATVLFELERTGTVQCKNNLVKLCKTSFSSPLNYERGLEVMVDDVYDLITSVESNLRRKEEIPNLHARTVFDNVRPKELTKIKAWIVTEGHKFHEKVRQFVSKHDQDINPQVNFKDKGLKVIVGSFSRIESDDKN